MSYLRFGLLVVAWTTVLTTETAVIHDVDWVTAETANKSVSVGNFVPTGYVSDWGLVQHWSSGKYVLPKNGVACPDMGVHLSIFSEVPVAEIGSFRFVQVLGHYGYIEHSCGLVMHPKGGSLDPGDHVAVELWDARHASSLFTYNHEEFEIIHRKGKALHPWKGSADPEDGTDIVFHGERHDASRFGFVDSVQCLPMSIFPPPLLFGTWRVIYAVINPLVDHEYRLSFTVGKSISKSATEGYEWMTSAAVSFGWFQASAEYRQWAEMTETTTWEAEIVRELTIRVPAGITVVTWQYFFEAEQFGDGLRFRSSILADTDDINTPPAFSQVFPNS